MYNPCLVITPVNWNFCGYFQKIRVQGQPTAKNRAHISQNLVNQLLQIKLCTRKGTEQNRTERNRTKWTRKNCSIKSNSYRCILFNMFFSESRSLMNWFHLKLNYFELTILIFYFLFDDAIHQNMRHVKVIRYMQKVYPIAIENLLWPSK